MSLNQPSLITMNDNFIRDVSDKDVRSMPHDIQKGWLLKARHDDCTSIVKSNSEIHKENTRARRGGRVDGLSKDKNMRRVGTIPLYVLVNKPELRYDDKALRKYLKEHPEWCTVNPESI